jgi:hypothetical protein
MLLTSEKSVGPTRRALVTATVRTDSRPQRQGGSPQPGLPRSVDRIRTHDRQLGAEAGHILPLLHPTGDHSLPYPARCGHIPLRRTSCAEIRANGRRAVLTGDGPALTGGARADGVLVGGADGADGRGRGADGRRHMQSAHDQRRRCATFTSARLVPLAPIKHRAARPGSLAPLRNLVSQCERAGVGPGRAGQGRGYGRRIGPSWSRRAAARVGS